MITDNGLGNWTNPSSIASTYFRLAQTGELNVAIKAKSPSGNSVVKVLVNGTVFTINLNNSKDYKTYFAGTANINAAGYVKVDLQGVK